MGDSAPASRTDAARRRFVGPARAAAAAAAAAAVNDGATSPDAALSADSIEDLGRAVTAVAVSDSGRPRAVAGAGAGAGGVPEDILQDKALAQAVKALPANYNFEIHKTVWQLRKAESKRAAVAARFTGVETVVMGDVTYGACCVDDFTAKALGCDFMVHYGHSCLIPVTVTTIKTLYVFVEIGIDMTHLLATVRLNFSPPARLVLVSTIQFVTALQAARRALSADGFRVTVPQSRPLSSGEILGCTAPAVATAAAGDGKGMDDDPPTILYLGDGRFHLESIMIANPGLRAFRYDPYAKALTRERYDHAMMRGLRARAIEHASAADSTRFGLILGTLGRQGSTKVLEHLRGLVLGTDATDAGTNSDAVDTARPAAQRSCRHREAVTVLLSEVTPEKLALFGDQVDAWVQTSCPRLSIDWGHAFARPLLTPYEAAVVAGAAPAAWRPGSGSKSTDGGGGAEDAAVTTAADPATAKARAENYPMDFYARDSLGAWTPNHAPPRDAGSGSRVARERLGQSLQPAA
ncbi:Diphthamide biosynthesis protein 1 [Cladochytrium tenue]|nr:Diphthamide biosynthesis protein 1 [Cladochytrium tenue]